MSHKTNFHVGFALHFQKNGSFRLYMLLSFPNFSQNESTFVRALLVPRSSCSIGQVCSLAARVVLVFQATFDGLGLVLPTGQIHDTIYLIISLPLQHLKEKPRTSFLLQSKSDSIRTLRSNMDQPRPSGDGSFDTRVLDQAHVVPFSLPVLAAGAFASMKSMRNGHSGG